MKGGACRSMGLSPRAVAVPNQRQAPPRRPSSSPVKPRSVPAAPPDVLLTRPETLNLCTWLMGTKSCQGEATSAPCEARRAWSPACCQATEFNACSREPAPPPKSIQQGVCAGQADPPLVSGLVTRMDHPDFNTGAPVLDAWALSPLGRASAWHRISHRNRWQRRGSKPCRGSADLTLTHSPVSHPWTVPPVSCRPGGQLQFRSFAGLFLRARLNFSAAEGPVWHPRLQSDPSR